MRAVDATTGVKDWRHGGGAAAAVCVAGLAARWTLAALATLQCHSINPTFTSSSDDAGRPGQSKGMEDEACTASGATSEAVA